MSARSIIVVIFVLTSARIYSDGYSAAETDWVEDTSGAYLCEGYYSPQLIERSPDDIINSEATNTKYDGSDRVVLTGNALITRDDFQIEADQISFLNSTGDGDAEGSVRIRRPDVLLLGETASVNVRTNAFDLQNSSFVTHKNHLRGFSDFMIGAPNGDIQMVNGSLTFCSPGVNSWDIQADQLHLNQSTGRGWADDVIIRIKDIPVFYTPFLGFPLDSRRMSGFFFPSFSSGSSVGTEIALPFYWDLSPNYDLLIRPRFMSTRGTAIGVHGRYLFRDLTLLEAKTERLLNDKVTLSDRHISRVTLSSNPLKALVWNMSYEDASDATYQNQLNNFAGLSNKEQLTSSIGATVRGDGWTTSWMIDSVKSINSAITGSDVKFSRQPQIAASWIDRGIDWNFFASGNATKFTRPVTGLLDTDPSEGLRLSTDLKAEYPISNAFGSLVPSALGFTRWSESKLSSNTYDDDYFAIGASLDGRLNFQKTGLDGSLYEIIPRAKLLVREPDEHFSIVKFDTPDNAYLIDTVDQMFLDNPVSGGDFVGDTRELALSMTSRAVNANGTEFYRITGGRTIFLQDRGITLSGKPEYTNKGPLVIESKINLSESFSWNTRFVSVSDSESMDTATNEIKYKTSATDYLTQRTVWENNRASRMDVYSSNQMSNDFRLLAGLQWEPNSNERINQIVGVEYESCCWRAAIVHAYERAQVTSASGGHSLKLKVELKGLSGLGHGVFSVMDRLLENYEFSEARH